MFSYFGSFFNTLRLQKWFSFLLSSEENRSSYYTSDIFIEINYTLQL